MEVRILSNRQKICYFIDQEYQDSADFACDECMRQTGDKELKSMIGYYTIDGHEDFGPVCFKHLVDKLKSIFDEETSNP